MATPPRSESPKNRSEHNLEYKVVFLQKLRSKPTRKTRSRKELGNSHSAENSPTASASSADEAEDDTGPKPLQPSAAYFDAQQQMEETMAELRRQQEALFAEARQALANVHEKEMQWAAILDDMAQQASKLKSRVRLNMGGKIFETSRSNLMLFEGSLFYALICCGEWTIGNDGAYFIDRNPVYFDHILRFVRDPTSPLRIAAKYKDKVLNEARYFRLDPLVAALEGLEHVTILPPWTSEGESLKLPNYPQEITAAEALKCTVQWARQRARDFEEKERLWSLRKAEAIAIARAAKDVVPFI